MNEAAEGRRQLIEAVQKHARAWEAVAQHAAMEAVRNAKDKDAHETARLYLAKHDACLKMADDVILEIHKHWPEVGQ